MASPRAVGPPGRLRHLDLVLTAGCNLSCSYCYQNAKQPKTRMAAETVRRSVELLLSSGERELTLGFYGGEPLLHFDLVREAVEHAERNRPRGKRLRYAIISNGTLLNDEVAGFLARHRFRTQLSFDGVSAAQALRGRHTFIALDALLDRLRRDHATWFQDDCWVLTTVLPSTVAHLADSFEYFAGKGVARICAQPQFTDTSGWRLEQIDELERELERIFDRSVAIFRDTGRILFDAFRKGDPDEIHAPRQGSMCGVASGSTLAVDVDGEVYGCVTFARSFQKKPTEMLRAQIDPLGMGHVDASDLPARLALYPRQARGATMLHRKEDKHSSYGRCGDCRYFTTCSVCPMAIGHTSGNDDPHRVPDFPCAWNLVVGKYRERFPTTPDPLEVLLGLVPLPLQMQSIAQATGPVARRRPTKRTAPAP